MKLKKLCALLPALLLLTACAPVSLRAESPAVPTPHGPGTEANMGEPEIQERLGALAAGVPKAETTEITLTALPRDEAETENSVTLYSAALGMTWDARLGRYSTEKALDDYSRALAVDVMSETPVVLLEIAWTIPYHAENEAAMRYSFARRGAAVWQTGLYDRFTDGSFGADAFLQTPVNPVPASVKIDAAPIAILSGSPPTSFWAPLPPTAEQAEIVKTPRRTASPRTS